MLWSWYLANDTQFYMIGAIILIVGVRHFKLSAITTLVFLVLSWITTAVVAFTNNHRPNTDDPLALFDKIYDKPWTRLGPYLIGMAVGWILFRSNCKIRLPKLTVATAWTWPCWICSSWSSDYIKRIYRNSQRPPIVHWVTRRGRYPSPGSPLPAPRVMVGILTPALSPLPLSLLARHLLRLSGASHCHTLHGAQFGCATSFGRGFNGKFPIQNTIYIFAYPFITSILYFELIKCSEMSKFHIHI